MRKIFTTVILMVLTIRLFAQAPEKMSYQAVIRDASDNLVANTSVGMQISILQGSATGTPVYIERQFPTTNLNGLVSIEIGGENATVITGDFTTIDWSTGLFFIKTETDPAGGSSYSITGISQLLSVPYALFAKEAGSVNYTETDPIYEASIASSIEGTDTANWNNKLDSYTESQSLSDVLLIGNSANGQIKDVSDPTDANDAVNKAYVDELKTMILELQAEIGVTDIDGNHYKVVVIGDQIWMAENLKTLKFNDNSSISLVENNIAWSELVTPGYCWYSNDSSQYSLNYGALYNYHAVVSGKLCPSGWRVPNSSEWDLLIDFYGGVNVAGGALKEIGYEHWNEPNQNATNESSFSGLPGGMRWYADGQFTDLGQFGHFWSKNPFYGTNEEYEKDYYYSYLLLKADNTTTNNPGFEGNGFSVRCVKD